jgi:hypothetical protein
MDNRKMKQLRAQTFDTINSLASLLPEEDQLDLDARLNELVKHIIARRVEHDRKPRP